MTFQRLGALLGVTALSVAVIACGEDTTTSPQMDVTPELAVDQTGNGAPSGHHYTLNVIATTEKNANMTGGNGKRIFVKLGSKNNGAQTKIYLCNSSDATGDCYGEDFVVLDANGTDGEAEFALPDPCSIDNADPTQECTSTSYSVWARALGQPGLTAKLTTCAEDVNDYEYCSTEQIEFEHKGRQAPKFGDVSRYLLTLALDITVTAETEAVAECLAGRDLELGDNVAKRVGLFNSCLEDYFWKYDNYGLRLLQLRFYMVPSNLPEVT